MRIWIVSLMIVCLLLSIIGQAQTTGTVVLSLEEYETLKKETARITPLYVLSFAHYRAVVEDQTLAIQGSLRGVLFTDQPVLIPLFKKGITIERATVKGEPAIISAGAEEQTYWAILGNPGQEVTLEVQLRTPISQEEGFYGAKLSIPPAGVAGLTVEFPYEEVQTHLNEQFQPTRPGPGGAGRVLEAVIGGQDTLALRWLPLSREVKPLVHVMQNLGIEHLDQRQVHYQLSMQLMVTRRPLDSLTIPMEGATSHWFVRGQERIARSDLREGQLHLFFKEPLIGRADLEVHLTVPTEDREGIRYQVPHMIPQEAASFSGHVAFLSSDLYRITILHQEQIQSVPVDQLLDWERRYAYSQAFHFWNQDFKLEYSLERITPEFTAAMYHSISFGETTCLLSTRADCLISQGAVHTFRLTLPPEFQLENVSGTSVRDWTLDPEGKAIEVTLHHAEREKTIFTLNWRRNYRDAEEIPVQLPEISGPRRFRGFLSISPQASVRIQVTSPQNLEVLEPSEVPQMMRGDLDQAPPFAYRYLEQPASLTVSAVRYEKARIESNRVERLLASLEFSAQGTIRTDVILNLRNTEFDMLPLYLPAHTALLSCQVNGLSVNPVIGDQPENLLVPVLRSPSQLSSIQLSYLTSGIPLERAGTVALPIPRITLPIDEAGIGLTIPPDFEVNLVSSDLFQRTTGVPPVEVQSIGGIAGRLEWVDNDANSPRREGVPKEVQDIAVALETYYVDNNSYPPQLQALVQPYQYMHPQSSFWEKYHYETDYLGTWKIGFASTAQRTTSKQIALTGDVHYAASYLRGSPEEILNHLDLKVRIRRRAETGSGLLVLLVLIVLAGVALFFYRRTSSPARPSPTG